MGNRLITCSVVYLCLQLTGTGDAWSQSPQSSPQTPDQAKQQAQATDDLIEQLGSERFSERERATEQLIRLGISAVVQLELAARSEDREVRQRCQLVLSVVQELDFARRLKSFDQNVAGDKSYGLPGWKRYRELVGNTPSSRSLFVQMQKAERDLLGAESESARVGAKILERRCQRLRLSIQIFRTRHELPPIAAALFVATKPDVRLDNSTNTSLIILCKQYAFESGMKSNVQRSTLRKLFAAWILKEDALPAYELLIMALQFNIDQSLPRARVLARGYKKVNEYDLRSAILCLAKFGGLDDIAQLKLVMEDERVISRYPHNSLTYTVEMRDLVLAALLKLTDREPSTFGYGRLRFQEPFVFDIRSLGFARDEDRQVAIAKWQTYQMRQEGG